MDLKKQITLSKPAPPTEPGTRTFPDAGGKQSRLLRKRKGREVVGLKIGASQLAASRMSNNGSARLHQLARRPLAPGIVDAGEVQDVPALAAALREFFDDYKLPRRGVRLGIATNRIGVQSFEMAGIEDDRQLANAIRFRAHEAVAIPVEDAVLDYHVVSETVDDDGSVTRRIVLAAAYRESIDRYTAACREAGIELEAIDLEAFALLRAVAVPVIDDDSPRTAVVAVTIGHDRTTLAISDGLVCDFTRVIEWGGSNLETAIAHDVGVGNIEAAELKHEVSLELMIAGAVDEADDQSRAREAVRRELQKLARELVASLQFYQSQPGSLAIAEILLTGGTTRMAGLPEELARLTRVGVRRADPLVRVTADESIDAGEDLSSYSVAIGLGVND